MSPSINTRENRQFASEIKFLVSRAQAALICDWARSRLSPDPHANCGQEDGYQITSLYFDTEQFDVFHRRGSFGRSKYRIRRYGASEVIFLERKLKTRGLLTKRRAAVGLDELERISGVVNGHSWGGRWFHRRLQARQLSAICQISYRRIALVAMTEFGPIRLTLDHDLQAQRAAGLWFLESETTPILKDRMILELKFRCAMPLLFKSLVEEFQLNPQPFSKYRLAATSLGLVADPETEMKSNCISQYA